MNPEALKAAIALTELGARRRAGAQEWFSAATNAMPFCAYGEDVNEAAARILLERVRELEAYAKRLEEAGDMVRNDLKLHWDETRSINAWEEAKESKP